MGRGAFFILAAGLLYGAWLFWSSSNDQHGAELAYENALTVPRLSAVGEAGRLAFNDECASCHGRDAFGGEGGPPLIHQLYEPGHHGDEAIRLAVRNGVSAHHWRFGDMPAQPYVAPESLDAIVAFLRETQAANGIR